MITRTEVMLNCFGHGCNWMNDWLEYNPCVLYDSENSLSNFVSLWFNQ